MQFLKSALALGSHADLGSGFPVAWSEQARSDLMAVSRGEGKTYSPLDVPLAIPLLKCGEGLIQEARSEIIQLLEGQLDTCLQDNETFISFLHALFVSQRFDLVAAMLRDRYGFGSPVEIELTEDGPGPGCVQWEIRETGEHRFTFDAACLVNGQARGDILIFQWEFPLFSFYSSQQEVEHGSVLINRGDIGTTPGLSYCASRPDFFLIPDYLFIPSRGYEYVRETFRGSDVPWSSRTPMAFWRGATTGVPTSPGEWRSLERIQLCEIARRDSTGLIDAGISSIVQFDNQDVVQEITNSGLVKGFFPWTEWNQYKYLIDIDGNSSPWSNFFQKLLTGSPVLKVESRRGLQQWYYDGLVPWKNYVPIAPDASDLVEKVKFLAKHDGLAEAIGRHGLEFATGLTYERELSRAVPVISAAFRYFRGDYASVAPFGRVVERERA